MEFSTLRNSFSISISLDADKAAKVAAIAVGKAVRNATQSVLESAIANARSAISAERTAKNAIWNIISTTGQITKAVLHSTDVRIEAVIEEKVIAPVMQTKAAITTPTRKAWNMALDGITDYLESTPIKAAEVAESFPVQVAQVEEAIADYTKIEGVEAIAEEVKAENSSDVFSEEWGIKAVEAAKQGHVLVGDKVMTEEGITNTTVVKEVQSKASSLSEMIREEVAKQ